MNACSQSSLEGTLAWIKARGIQQIEVLVHARCLFNLSRSLFNLSRS